MMRCGATDSIDKLEEIIKIAFDMKLDYLYKEHKDLLKNSLKRVIALDENYPPENDIDYACQMVKGVDRQEVSPVPEVEWPKIRNSLINSAKQFVNEGVQKPSSKAAEKIKNSAKDY